MQKSTRTHKPFIPQEQQQNSEQTFYHKRTDISVSAGIWHILTQFVRLDETQHCQRHHTDPQSYSVLFSIIVIYLYLS